MSNAPTIMENGSPEPTRQPNYYWLLVLAGVVFGFALINLLPHETADEGFHAPTIWEYYHKNYDYLNPYIAMFPTYHLIMAWFIRQIGKWDISLLRAVHLLVSLLVLPVFSAIIRRQHPGEQQMRTAQFFFFPLFFPFFFVVYTDMWGLLAVLFTVMLTLRRQHLWAGLAGLLAVLLRQHNILWVGFCLLLIALEPPTDDAKPISLPTIVGNPLRQGWVHLLVCVAFVIFVVINKGVAVGDRGSNPFVFHVTNFYTCLIWSWAMLLPGHCARLPAIWGLLRKPWIIAATIAGLFVYLATYNNWHGLNQPGSDYYLRNRLLTVMTASAIWRAVMYIPIAWSVLSFACIKFTEKRFYLLYFFGPLSIVLMPVIEPRYYIPALALLIAFRPPEKPAVETTQLAHNIVLASILTFCIAHQFFFP